MSHCKPRQYALVIRSICGNEGKVVFTLRNEGTIAFRRPGLYGYERVERPNVWSVQQVKQPLVSSRTLDATLKARYGSDVDGLFPDADLLPLNDPDMEDEIVEEHIQELQGALASFDQQKEKK